VIKILSLTFFISLILPKVSFACWQLKGTLTFDQHEVKVDQKIVHDQTYSFQTGPIIFNIGIPKEKALALKYEIVKKDGLTLEKVSQGELQLKQDKHTSSELSKIDPVTGKMILFKLSIKSI
jgi:hypothetical protein